MSKFWARVAESPRIVVDFATGEMWKQLPWALAALGISTAGIVAALVFIKIAEWLTRSQSTERYFYEQKRGFYKRYTHTSKSLIRLAGMSLATLSVIFGFWIGANTLGVNFWTLILGYGIVGIVMTYAFGSILRSAGAFFALAMSIKIEEGAVVTIGNIKGRIRGIHILWVELEDLGDLEKGIFPPQEIYVPTWNFIEFVMWRDYEKQAEIEHMFEERKKKKKAPSVYPVTTTKKKILL